MRVEEHLLVCGVSTTLPYDERALLQLVADGDEQAFTELVVKYGNTVFSFVQRHCRSRELAEEIVQDVFTQIWLIRNGLPEINNFEAFLYIISRNYAFDALRKLLRSQKRQVEYHELAAIAPDPVENEDWKVDLINSAVGKLPPQQQKVWQLSRRDGLKGTQIAEQMNLSKETVKKYLQYATASIIKYVERHLNEILVLLILNRI